MVDKRTPILMGTLAAALIAGSAIPVSAAFSQSAPSPLRREPLVRIRDIASSEPAKAGTKRATVAIGWRERSEDGDLFMAFSKNGGKTFGRDAEGGLRRFPVAGDGKRGLSVDVCGGYLWAGSAANFPTDDPEDTDVLITRKKIGGPQDQAFVTAPADDREVRDVSIACVGRKLLAIAWLEKINGRSVGRLMLRDLEGVIPTATNKVYGLGLARHGGGIAIAATNKSVHVAWTKGSNSAIRYKRFLIGNEDDPTVTKFPTVTLASTRAVLPRLGAMGQKVALAYTDGGKVKVRLSKNLGAAFGAATTIVNSGTVRRPSKPHSVDVHGARVVVEATRSGSGGSTPLRLQSTDFGASWTPSSFGHKGPRLGVLRRNGRRSSLLNEIWLHNGSARDTMRGQYER